MGRRRKHFLVFFLLVVFVTVACSDDQNNYEQPPGAEDSGMIDEGGSVADDGEGRMEGDQPQKAPGSQGSAETSDEHPSGQSDEADINNGERIYFTATNEADEHIPYTGGPEFGGMMMGDYLPLA